jgi:hypothetical protein
VRTRNECPVPARGWLQSRYSLDATLRFVAFEGVVAVLWNGDDTPVAVHIEDLERRS